MNNSVTFSWKHYYSTMDIFSGKVWDRKESRRKYLKRKWLFWQMRRKMISSLFAPTIWGRYLDPDQHKKDKEKWKAEFGGFDNPRPNLREPRKPVTQYDAKIKGMVGRGWISAERGERLLSDSYKPRKKG